MYETNGKPIIWARSAYAGSQRYPVHWAGDPKADLRSMYSTLRGGLSFGMSGFTFWSHDMGGFTPRPSEETYQRWSQFGFWTSHSRCHGVPPREPYSYSKTFLENFKKYDSIKYRLLPYIYSQAYHSMQKGIPILRAMVLEYESDPTTYPIDDQYLFGDSFLIAPVIEYGCTERMVYFPAGLWYTFESNSQIEGPCWQTVATPSDLIPVFVRAGSIIPMGPVRQFITEKPEETLDLRIYPLRNVNKEVIDQVLTFKYYDLQEMEWVITIKQGIAKLVSKIPGVHSQIILH